MRSVIVGTAGHIDHGKTALVRALTGVDADRLPEEKRRGITIDLGFAELDLGDVRVGFVDVPGHERFVKNMLAGAHGIDLVALVVAADEGVMPQTREHFDICRLLGVRAGLVVITKTDTVDEELLELVRAEADELVAGSFLEGAPVVAVSSRTGAGVEELKSKLHEAALAVPARDSDAVTRLPVDRSFTMRGFGAVVTGTLVAGEIAEGQELELLPAGARVRVRGLQGHGAAGKAATAGQRTAVNLGGVEAASVVRGMVLAPAGRLSPTQIMDARVSVLNDAPRALKTRQRVRVHHGTAEVLARVVVLEAAGEPGEIAPGASGLVQLRLESPVVALPGDRFILRTYSPQRTVAGGEVLDAHAPKHRGRERASARERLASLEGATASGRLPYFVAPGAGRGARARARRRARRRDGLGACRQHIRGARRWRDSRGRRRARRARGLRGAYARGGRGGRGAPQARASVARAGARDSARARLRACRAGTLPRRLAARRIRGPARLRARTRARQRPQPRSLAGGRGAARTTRSRLPRGRARSPDARRSLRARRRGREQPARTPAQDSPTAD